MVEPWPGFCLYVPARRPSPSTLDQIVRGARASLSGSNLKLLMVGERAQSLLQSRRAAQGGALRWRALGGVSEMRLWCTGPSGGSGPRPHLE